MPAQQAAPPPRSPSPASRQPHHVAQQYAPRNAQRYTSSSTHTAATSAAAAEARNRRSTSMPRRAAQPATPPANAAMLCSAMTRARAHFVNAASPRAALPPLAINHAKLAKSSAAPPTSPRLSLHSCLAPPNLIYLAALIVSSLVCFHHAGLLPSMQLAASDSAAATIVLPRAFAAAAIRQQQRQQQHHHASAARARERMRVPGRDTAFRSGAVSVQPLPLEQNLPVESRAVHRLPDQLPPVVRASPLPAKLLPEPLLQGADAPLQQQPAVQSPLHTAADAPPPSSQTISIKRTKAAGPPPSTAAPVTASAATAAANATPLLLNFSTRTAINFMHFHKTGGVSFKTSLHKFYIAKTKRDGQPVIVRDSCYARNISDTSDKPTFLLWRCDWEPIRQLTQPERDRHDFVIGHQFAANGVDTLLSGRDVRTFAIMRHPFDRKVSFYFHFFVRELRRSEADVSFEEIRDFLLYDRLVVKANLGRDLGPNYMAGRLLSNGVDGYVGNATFSHFKIEPERKQSVADRAKKLIGKYVFIGLQSEAGASKCMLRKVVEAFNGVNGIDNSGVELIDRHAEVLNTGSYTLTPQNVWSQLTETEREYFDHRERVDLLIYQEGERLFKRDVRRFGCGNRVLQDKYKS